MLYRFRTTLQTTDYLLLNGIKFETDSLFCGILVHTDTFEIRENPPRMAAEAKKEEAKRIRTSAKSRFTRKRNEFLKSIQDNKGMDAVKRTFADLHEAWNIVEGKHDIYMIHLTEDEIEQNEAWINELQELYEEAATAHAQYVNDQTLHEQKRVEEFHKQESMRHEQEKLKRLLEQFSIKKKSMRTIFDTLVEHAHDAMESQNKDVNTPETLRTLPSCPSNVFDTFPSFHWLLIRLESWIRTTSPTFDRPCQNWVCSTYASSELISQ